MRATFFLYPRSLDQQRGDSHWKAELAQLFFEIQASLFKVRAFILAFESLRIRQSGSKLELEISLPTIIL